MKRHISRRDFLKLAGLLPFSMAAPRLVNSLASIQPQAQNVIVVVFDAFSASNISLYGYQRETTPNLARLAERAIVYHNHYAGANFTAPGTATLLTGTLPWTHRAFHHAGRVEEASIKANIFSAFEAYYRLAYSHNPMANGILGQFNGSLDNYIPRGKLFLKNDNLVSALFENDDDIATVSWLRAMKGATEEAEEGFSYSLFLSHILDAYDKVQDRQIEGLRTQFPLGLPSIFTDNYYMLEDAIDWFGDMLSGLPKPFISYLHFMPPHAPYRTHREFYGRFDDDGWTAIAKPYDLFSRESDRNPERMLKKRILYDEFILYVDREFGRFFDALEKSGLLQDTWVILTSDHGEMFERGINGHTTPVLYDPVIRIPLMIFEPGRNRRADVHAPTSAIDMLPTLLHVTSQPAAGWAEGMVLPPFSDSYPSERSIFALEARKNGKHAPLNVATAVARTGQYKLMYFWGYGELGAETERIELYDLERDPEETKNLAASKRETTSELLNELKTKLAEVNKPYL
jgi:arylsulfatase A-like enzyme